MCTEKITIFWPFLCGRQIICECFCEILYAIKKATTDQKKICMNVDRKKQMLLYPSLFTQHLMTSVGLNCYAVEQQAFMLNLVNLMSKVLK